MNYKTNLSAVNFVIENFDVCVCVLWFESTPVDSLVAITIVASQLRVVVTLTSISKIIWE